MIRADIVSAAPASARTLAADLTTAGWRWAAGGHLSPNRAVLRIQGVDPRAPQGIRVTWEDGRLHSCVLWSPVLTDAPLKAARALVQGSR